jgi:hypothetical protein
MRATITEHDHRITIELRRDPDAYRWYESATGADTEVSAPTERDAVLAAQAAWRSWDFRVEEGE